MKMKKIVKIPLRRAAQPRRPAATSLRARTATADAAYEEDEDYESEEEPNMKFTHALFVVLILHVIAVGGVFAFNWMKTRQGDSSQAAKAPAAVKSLAEEPEKSEPAAKPVAAAKPDALKGWTGKTHTVEPGDTLIQIAATYKTNVAAIEKENDITSYSLLRVGQILKIPGTAKASRPAAETPKTKSSTTKEAFLATKTESAPKPAGVVTAAPKPAAESAAPAKSAPKSAEAKTPAAPADVYVVAKGDNPYTIAKKLHVSYNELLSINDIKDATKIQIGQKLKIPKP